MSLNDKRQIINRFAAAVLHSSLTSVWIGSTDEGAGDPYVSLIKPSPSKDGQTLYISSTSTDDVMTTGTGAWKVLLEGLDSQFLPFTEVLELNGTTKVPTSYDGWTYVCRATVIETGSGGEQDGDIFIGDDTYDPADPDGAGDIYTMIGVTGISANDSFAKGTSQQACFTIPAGYEGRFRKIYANREAGNTDGRMYIRIKDISVDNAPWVIDENSQMAEADVDRTFNIYTLPDGSIVDESEVIPELTEVEMVGISDNTNVEFNGGFIIQIDRVVDIAAAMSGSITTSDFTSKGFTASWTEPENLNFVDSYKIIITDDDDSSYRREYSVPRGTSEFTFNKLFDGHDYTVEVSSVFGDGESDPITEAAITVGLEAPSDFTATGDDGVVNFTWTDNSTTETGFELERFGIIEETFAADATSGSDTDVVNDITYSYRLRAVDEFGGASDWAGPVTATPTDIVTGSFIIGGDQRLASSDNTDGSYIYSTDEGATFETGQVAGATGLTVTTTGVYKPDGTIILHMEDISTGGSDVGYTENLANIASPSWSSIADLQYIMQATDGSLLLRQTGSGWERYAGSGWQSVTGITGSPHDFQIHTDGTNYYILQSPTEIVVSSDQGANWDLMTNLPSMTSIDSISCTSSLMVAVGDVSGNTSATVEITSDFGATPWTSGSSSTVMTSGGVALLACDGTTFKLVMDESDLSASYLETSTDGNFTSEAKPGGYFSVRIDVADDKIALSLADISGGLGDPTNQSYISVWDGSAWSTPVAYRPSGELWQTVFGGY